MKQRIIALLLIAILGGIFLSVSYVNPYADEISLASLILQLSGSRDSLVLGTAPQELLSVAMRWIPSCLFEAYAGIMLYQHFCIASVYIFSRCSKRGMWYLKQTIILLLKTMVFQLILLLTVWIVSKVRTTVYVDMGGINMMLYHFIIQSLWTYFCTLLINLLALYMGSNMSFIIVMGIQCLGIVGLGVHRYSQEFLKYNPLSCLILGWHYSIVENVDKYLNAPFDFLCIETSISILIGMCVMLVMMGAIVIKKYDILISNVEIGVI